jgi:hypothetical protein
VAYYPKATLPKRRLRARPLARNEFGALGLKKYLPIEESLAVDSRNRCKTTTGGDNE